MGQETLENLQEELQKNLFEKAENEMGIRQGELIVKRINASANLEKRITERMKVELELKRFGLEERRFELDERRLSLNELQVKYNIASDMIKKADKIQRAIGKTMMGIFPEQDKQVVQIYKASKKLAELK